MLFAILTWLRFVFQVSAYSGIRFCFAMITRFRFKPRHAGRLRCFDSNFHCQNRKNACMCVVAWLRCTAYTFAADYFYPFISWNTWIWNFGETDTFCKIWNRTAKLERWIVLCEKWTMLILDTCLININEIIIIAPPNNLWPNTWNPYRYGSNLILNSERSAICHALMRHAGNEICDKMGICFLSGILWCFHY